MPSLFTDSKEWIIEYQDTALSLKKYWNVWTLLHNFQLSTKAAVTLTSRIHLHYCELHILATVLTCNWMHWKQVVSTQDMNLSQNRKDL